jgi:hypothetical protein
MNLSKLISSFTVLMVMTMSLMGCSPHDYSVSRSPGQPASSRTFTMTKGPLPFSFQYNSRYKVDPYNAYYSPNPYSVDVNTGDYVAEIIGPNDTRITIHGWFAEKSGSVNFTNAEERMSDIFPRMLEKDAVILEQSDVTVSGAPAKLIAYHERDITRAIVGMYIDKSRGQTSTKKIPPQHVVREVDFDYNHFIWFIEIDSTDSEGESVKDDWEQVVKTFKILD